METFDLYQFLNINGTHLDNISTWRWGKDGIIEKLLVKPTPQIKINIHGFVNDNPKRYLGKVDSLEKEAQARIGLGFLQTKLSDLSSLKQYETYYSTIMELYADREQQERRFKSCESFLKGSWVRRALNLYSKEELKENKRDAEGILTTIQIIKPVLIKIDNAPISIQIAPEAQKIYEQVKEFQVNPSFFDLINYNKVNAVLSEAYGIKVGAVRSVTHPGIEGEIF